MRTEDCSTATVTFPIADRTTQGKCSGNVQMMSNTSRILSAVATDEPPNFITTVTCTERLLSPN